MIRTSGLALQTLSVCMTALHVYCVIKHYTVLILYHYLCIIKSLCYETFSVYASIGSTYMTLNEYFVCHTVHQQSHGN